MPDPDAHTSQLSGMDLLRLTATDIRGMLERGSVSSKILIQSYLSLIKAHNHEGMNLRAILDLAPEDEILRLAEELDNERSNGSTRGPFHGVPIVVKDTINSDFQLGMGTTLGSFALKGAKPPGNAKVIQTLLERGLLLLGKANLSEFGSNKCPGFVPGFSPVGGQTRSAYVDSPDGNKLLQNHDSPMGSSSGSAVAVAAGFSPWSIGAETDGSLNSPASRSSLYALKPTPGIVSDDGVFKLTDAFDTLGAMAKSVEDLAALTDMLFASKAERPPAPWSLSQDPRKDFRGLRIGFVDIDMWQLPKSILEPDTEFLEQRRSEWQRTMQAMKDLGADIQYPIQLKPASEYTYEGQSGYSIIRYGQWPALVKKYLFSLTATEVRSLDDIIEFSSAHPDLEFYPEAPSQQSLINVLDLKTSPEFIDKALTAMRAAAGEHGIGKAIDDYNLDVLVAPTDSPISTIAALAGYPVGTMPLGYIQPSGRPHGLSVLAKADQERKILEVMGAYEASVFERKLPPPLVKRLLAASDAKLFVASGGGHRGAEHSAEKAAKLANGTIGSSKIGHIINGGWLKAILRRNNTGILQAEQGKL